MEQATAISHSAASIELNEIARAAASRFDASDLGILLTADDATAVATAASTPLAADANACQIRVGEGPTFDAVSAGAVQAAAVLSDEQRWPKCRDELVRLGIGSVVAYPLQVGDKVIGSLTTYSSEASARSDTELSWGAAIAEAVAATIVSLAAQPKPASSNGALGMLRLTLDESQAMFHQATGMVAARADCSIDDASIKIREHAAATDTTVTAVARAVVDGTVILD